MGSLGGRARGRGGRRRVPLGTTADRECGVSVAAQPIGTDVPPWPEGHGQDIFTTVLSRLLTTC